MPDSRSRRFATWAFSFKPLGGNLRIAAATHISELFCPERQKSGKNASSRFSRAGEPRSGRKPPRIRRTSSSRRAETEKARHLLRELVPRRSALPQVPREANPAAQQKHAGRKPSSRDSNASQKLSCKPQPCRDLRGVPQHKDDEN